ncbi:MAG: O-methyltransferase [Lachnospiraceae bacterium]|nr:O-methyltransferase [Lachnospiraceae bacterium]
MITDERTEVFIRSFDTINNDLLDKLEKEAREEAVPIIRPAAKELLRLMIAMKAPKNILEIGTATGFSAIFMASCSKEGTKITTIEKYEPRIKAAKENIERSKMSGRITLLEGDATDMLKSLSDQRAHYDLVFMDAAKGQYITFLPYILRLLDDGGILVSDNVLQDGELIESRFVVKRRNRTIHSRMREYLYELTHNKELVTNILPIADGMTVSVKRNDHD